MNKMELAFFEEQYNNAVVLRDKALFKIGSTLLIAGIFQRVPKHLILPEPLGDGLRKQKLRIGLRRQLGGDHAGGGGKRAVRIFLQHQPHGAAAAIGFLPVIVPLAENGNAEGVGVAALHMIQNKMADSDLPIGFSNFKGGGRIIQETGCVPLGDLLHGLVMGRGWVSQPTAGKVADGLAHRIVQVGDKR